MTEQPQTPELDKQERRALLMWLRDQNADYVGGT